MAKKRLKARARCIEVTSEVSRFFKLATFGCYEAPRHPPHPALLFSCGGNLLFDVRGVLRWWCGGVVAGSLGVWEWLCVRDGALLRLVWCVARFLFFFARVARGACKRAVLTHQDFLRQKCAKNMPTQRPTQVCRRNQNQPGTAGKVTDLARTDHPAAIGEFEPPVALPRTPPPAIVWYQQEPILKRYPAIDATDTSASRAWVHVGQPAPKTALKASHDAHYRPDECLGSHGARPR